MKHNGENSTKINTPRAAGLLAVLVLFASLYMTQVFADVTGADGVRYISSARRNFNGTAPDSLSVQAGNVSAIELNASVLSQWWAGFYGNITGRITLDNANNDTFYDWNLTGAQTGEVYASRRQTPIWTGTNGSVHCINGTNMTDEEIDIGQNTSTSRGENVSETFTQGTNHPTFSVGDVTINNGTCPATTTYVSGAEQSPEASWFNVLLSDGANYSVYATIIDDAETGFDGSPHDFQMLVGECGNPNDACGTTLSTYYFFLELDG